MPKDRWQQLCAAVSADDRLPVREVGRWTEEKLYFWNRYIEITTSAMTGKATWPAGLVYVDLFAGPGVCRIKSSGRRIPGSALIAANAPKAFRQILLVEMDPILAETCSQRLTKTRASNSFRMFQGDSNEVIGQLLPFIPDRAMTLAFIDPEGLDAKFETIRTLTSDRRVDLLVLFADAYDVVRNVDQLYFKNLDSKLDQTLGPNSNWRQRWHSLGNQGGTQARALFAEIYKDQLRNELGYQVFGEKVMKSGKGPLYRLIYASKSTKGMEFWDKVTNKDAGGQLGFNYTG
jgi:three-Cys-motif partner protein